MPCRCSKPSPRLFERGTSLDRLVTEVGVADQMAAYNKSFITEIACDQLQFLCPDYEQSRVAGSALCRSGEDSFGYPYRMECCKGCIVSQFSDSGVFTGEEEAEPEA